jgi:single-strand DNA-binding protein
MMLNKVVIQGRLVADPEIRTTQSGTSAASFRVAVDRGFKSKDPNAPTADFINVVAWRQTADFISKYFTKGSMILVDGRLQTRDFTDKNGNRRFVTEVVAENVHFAGSKRESGSGNSGNSGNGGNGGNGSNRNYGNSNYGEVTQFPGNATAASNGFAELAEDDGELPF